MIDRTLIIVLIISIMLIIMYQYIQFLYSKIGMYKSYGSMNNQNIVGTNNVENTNNVGKFKKEIIVKTPTHLIDPIREYDYRKMNDPLEEPTRRVARYEIPPYYVKNLIDFPSRGYPDNFSQIGVLVRDNNKSKTDTTYNKIIRLFGRQEYPGSYRYEYYAMVSDGNDIIKIPIDIRNKKELYEDDVVHIKELGERYRVRLHKYDAPKYYPDIL